MSKSLVGNKTVSREMKKLRLRKKITDKVLLKLQEKKFIQHLKTPPYVRARQPKVNFDNERYYGD